MNGEQTTPPNRFAASFARPRGLIRDRWKPKQLLLPGDTSRVALAPGNFRIYQLREIDGIQSEPRRTNKR
jgi:hypothetical protein